MEMDDLMDALVEEVQQPGWTAQMACAVVAMDMSLPSAAMRMSDRSVNS